MEKQGRPQRAVFSAEGCRAAHCTFGPCEERDSCPEEQRAAAHCKLGALTAQVEQLFWSWRTANGQRWLYADGLKGKDWTLDVQSQFPNTATSIEPWKCLSPMELELRGHDTYCCHQSMALEQRTHLCLYSRPMIQTSSATETGWNQNSSCEFLRSWQDRPKKELKEPSGGKTTSLAKEVHERNQFDQLWMPGNNPQTVDAWRHDNAIRTSITV